METKQEQVQENTNKNNNQVKNTNMLLDIILKTARIEALSYELIDFINAANYDAAMILNKEEYETVDKAITTIAELLRKRHVTLLQEHLKVSNEPKQ